MEVEGEDVVNKYVTRTKEESRKSAHVGGGLSPESDPVDPELKLNKHGIESEKEY